MPKISIVLPVYNGERYLKYSVDSILSQTFADYELIVVDDCSTDESFRIAAEYAKQDKRIRVIRNAVNQKLPESLNIGFRHADGEYFTWTSDDNMYLSMALEEMSEYLDTHTDVDMICTGMVLINAEAKYLGEHRKYSLKEMYLDNTVGASFMYRRSVFTELGEYNTSLFGVEDYEYWIRILSNGKHIAYLPGCYYVYRMHEQSLTVLKRQEITKKKRALYVQYLSWILTGIRDDPNSLTYIYNQLLMHDGIDFEDIKRQFSMSVPWIHYDCEIPMDDHEIMLYGNGNVGKIAQRLLGNRIRYIVDRKFLNHEDNTGNTEFINPACMLTILQEEPDLHVVIAVSYEKQTEIAKWLIHSGIKSFSLYSHISSIGDFL